ncbi:hypothetical protein, partial [Pseudodonghicola flavimaris]
MVDITVGRTNAAPGDEIPLLIRDVLFQDFETLRLTGATGAIDLLFPEFAAGDHLPDDDGGERVRAFFDFMKGSVYVDDDVQQDAAVFEVAVFEAPLDGKLTSSRSVTLRFEGRDFTFADDPLDTILPTAGTIERITITDEVSFASLAEPEDFVPFPVGLKLSLTGLDLDASGNLLDDTDTLMATIFAGPQTLTIDGSLIPRFAGDGRDLTAGTRLGSGDFITLASGPLSPRITDPVWTYAGDFLTVEAGAVLNGGQDVLVGSLPGMGPGDLAGAIAQVSGDALDVAGEVNGGNDVLNFTDSLTAASAGLFGDAARVS